MPTNEQSEPNLQFQAPPGWQVPTGVVVSLPPPSPRPTIPRPVLPDRGRDRTREHRIRVARERLAKQARHEADRLQRQRLAKLAKLSRGLNGVAAAFSLGWEIGDYLFPEGIYSFGTNGPPDNTVGPDGWSNPYWSPMVICGTVGTCANTDYTSFRFHAHAPLNGTCVCTASNESPVYDNPVDALNATSPGNTLFVYNTTLTNPNAMRKWGQKTRTPGAPADAMDHWTQTFTSVRTAPMPLTGPFPSEMPEAFPLSQPMHPPWPTPWADAAPLPGEQSPPRDRGGGIPATPLAPFPVVGVRTPPGGALPPPTQVITVPEPPFPGGGGGQPGFPPVTIHTRPNPGNRPPPRKTKEKKLSVRSKANKAWIVLNLATEVFDFIDALFKGLPDYVRKEVGASIDYGREGGGNADPYSKLKAVWDHWDEMNWDDAMQSFINNQIEDMVVGGIGAAATSANKVSGAATGGGGAVSGRPQGFASDAQQADGREPDELPIPTVEYNEETGRWEVTVPLSKAGLGDDLTFV